MMSDNALQSNPLTDCQCIIENIITECTKYNEHIAILEKTITTQANSLNIMLAFLGTMLFVFLVMPFINWNMLRKLDKEIRVITEANNKNNESIASSLIKVISLMDKLPK